MIPTEVEFVTNLAVDFDFKLIMYYIRICIIYYT